MSPYQAAPTNRSLDHELERAGSPALPDELHPEAASLDAALDRHQLAAAAIRQRLLESRKRLRWCVPYMCLNWLMTARKRHVSFMNARLHQAITLS